jgi:protein-L-isoaspartate(D-aspartate) O-methyltransferase
MYLGPFLGSRDWDVVRKVFRVPRESREGIFRIGLFGATGMAAFDKLEMKKVPR